MTLAENRNPKVAIILLNWNNEQYTMQCISSIYSGTYLNIIIIIVDNGSRPENMDSIIQLGYPIEMIRLGKNLGFAASNNIGIRHALNLHADYIMILNNDAILQKNAIPQLLECSMALENNCLLSPLIYYNYDRNRIWYAGATGALWRGRVKHNLELKDSSSLFISTIFATGCCTFAHRNVFLKIGGYDASFFIYGEDYDLSLRAKNQGVRVALAPQAIIFHDVGATMGKFRDPRRSDKNCIRQHYLLTRNRIWVSRRNYLWWQNILYFLQAPLLFMKKLIPLMMCQNWLACKAVGMGFLHGWLGNMLRNPGEDIRPEINISFFDYFDNHVFLSQGALK